jgi:hypothetical protein
MNRYPIRYVELIPAEHAPHRKGDRFSVDASDRLTGTVVDTVSVAPTPKPSQYVSQHPHYSASSTENHPSPLGSHFTWKIPPFFP